MRQPKPKVEVITNIRLAGVDVARIHLHDTRYFISWRTGVNNLDGIRAIRSFYNKVACDLGAGYKFCELGPGALLIRSSIMSYTGTSLDEFLSDEKFTALLNGQESLLVLLTSYGNILFDMEGHQRSPDITKYSERGIYVASNLGLASQLSPFIQVTHAEEMPKKTIPKIRHGLEIALARYRR